ncbi:MAG: hypothetical protein O2870_08705 [Actinobacteria bacterium]|nr:hypothetical protein [Actinomycetota bacterium]
MSIAQLTDPDPQRIHCLGSIDSGTVVLTVLGNFELSELFHAVSAGNPEILVNEENR